MEAVREFQSDHEVQLKAAMDQLVASGAEEGFLIFETEDGKFIQFSFEKGNGLTVELSRVGMSDAERRRLTELEDMQAMNETEVTYQLQVGVDTKMAARLANRIFRDVFGCEGEFRVKATLDAESP